MEPQLLPACVPSVTVSLVICMTVCSVCITVTGSTVVGAAVIEKQLTDFKSEAVFGCVDRGLEVSSR